MFKKTYLDKLSDDGYFAEEVVAAGVGRSNHETREDWLKKQLKRLKADSTILDAGAGELHNMQFCKHLRYTSQDFAQYDGQGDGKGLQTESWDNTKLDIVSDITKIPLPEKSFDAIMCIEVFEHIPEPTKALKEFARILRTDGTLILTAPTAALTHFAPYFYATGLSRYFYEYHLPKMGLEIVSLTINGNYFDYIAQELIRLESMSVLYSPVASKFSNEERASVISLLKKLRRLSDGDTGSSELASFGIQVVAKRVRK